MFNMTKRKKKGFSLLELLLVFGIIAALIVGVFMIYPKISSGQKIDSDIKILGTLNAGIKNPRFYVSTSKSIIKALINMHSFEIQLSPIG
ncbi:type II secretion system protein [Klebsiella pneumoniae]|nr:type II secretion system protein [Klebsiella pneumoniae]